jgi:FKBP-type peptidyl-prolyl cis-trans isomerase FkpA
MKRLLFVMSISALLTSCGYKKAELDAFDSKIKQYNAKHQLLLKPTGSGLYLKVDTIGTGRPIQLQDSIWVSYTLKLLSGKIIEVQDQAIGLPLIGLIKGWQEALYGVPVGSYLRCIVPPQLAYGQAGTDRIGKDKILYFKMKVIDAK